MAADPALMISSKTGAHNVSSNDDEGKYDGNWQGDRRSSPWLAGGEGYPDRQVVATTSTFTKCAAGQQHEGLGIRYKPKIRFLPFGIFANSVSKAVNQKMHLKIGNRNFG
jgi:hypothetical protein